jgi:ABC-type spermidine/putrescine transport system permease subunit I
MTTADTGPADPDAIEFDGRDETVEVPASRRAALITLVVAGLIFAWSVYAAVGNVIQVPQLFAQYRDFVTSGDAPSLAKPTPWAALIAGLVVPIVGYLVALRLGRGRSLRSRVVVFVVTYAAVCALTVSLTGYVFQASSRF